MSMERLRKYGTSLGCSTMLFALGCGDGGASQQDSTGGVAGAVAGGAGTASGGAAAASTGGTAGTAGTAGSPASGGNVVTQSGGTSPTGGAGGSVTTGGTASVTVTGGSGGTDLTGGAAGAAGTAGTTGGTAGATGGTAGSSGGSGGATGGTAGSTGGSGGGQLTNVPYILGADISFVQEQEDRGTTFSDGSGETDLLQILKNHGFNYIRLRIFHDPGQPNGYQYEFVTRAEPYCDLDHTVEMAQRVKAAGMGLLLDFHYSDTWADPDDQHKPAAWTSLDFGQLTTAVHDYTRDTLQTLQAAGALPDMVQVGNEITPGMLLPDGATYDPDNWDQLAILLTAGLSAVKEVNSGIQTMLHIDRGGDNSTSVWWVDEALSRGVQFDVLGQSCYSVWHGPPSDWQANFTDLAGRYPDLSFVIAEYADNYREANDIMYDLPSGLGTFFWEPTSDGEWGTGLFDGQGQARSTLSLYDQMATDYGLR
jgi:arabinogalactan endo-1,4-beta-galactosidase